MAQGQRQAQPVLHVYEATLAGAVGGWPATNADMQPLRVPATTALCGALPRLDEDSRSSNNSSAATTVPAAANCTVFVTRASAGNLTLHLSALTLQPRASLLLYSTLQAWTVRINSTALAAFVANAAAALATALDPVTFVTASYFMPCRDDSVYGFLPECRLASNDASGSGTGGNVNTNADTEHSNAVKSVARTHGTRTNNDADHVTRDGASGDVVRRMVRSLVHHAVANALVGDDDVDVAVTEQRAAVTTTTLYVDTPTGDLRAYFTQLLCTSSSNNNNVVNSGNDVSVAADGDVCQQSSVSITVTPPTANEALTRVQLVNATRGLEAALIFVADVRAAKLLTLRAVSDWGGNGNAGVAARAVWLAAGSGGGGVDGDTPLRVPLYDEREYTQLGLGVVVVCSATTGLWALAFIGLLPTALIILRYVWYRGRHRAKKRERQAIVDDEQRLMRGEVAAGDGNAASSVMAGSGGNATANTMMTTTALAPPPGVDASAMGDGSGGGGGGDYYGSSWQQQQQQQQQWVMDEYGNYYDVSNMPGAYAAQQGWGSGDGDGDGGDAAAAGDGNGDNDAAAAQNDGEQQQQQYEDEQQDGQQQQQYGDDEGEAPHAGANGGA